MAFSARYLEKPYVDRLLAANNYLEMDSLRKFINIRCLFGLHNAHFVTVVAKKERNLKNPIEHKN